MAYQDMWHCPVCGRMWIEDDQMWEEPCRCPQCGTDCGDAPTPEPDEGG